MKQGRIIKIISNDYTVSQGGIKYLCKCRGIFRNKKIKPLVGDLVEFNEKENIIEKILPRNNELIRPPVSNVDQALVITSVKDPDFSSNLLSKQLVILEYNHITPIICFTKLDLLTDTNKINNLIKYYQKIGYTVLKNTEINKIKKLFENKITVFTGQTGAGKSSLINKLDSNFKLKTGEISKALGRGKHTTRHTELYSFNKGLVADTPGFSDIDLSNLSKEDIRDNFIEFEQYKSNCKYRDCMHDKEDICAVKEAVNNNLILKERYLDYLNFIHK